MPTGVSGLEGIENTAQPKFKAGDICKINLVALTNGLGMFGGLIPEITLMVKGAGQTPGTWEMCDINYPNATRIPSCPENVMTKI